MSIWNRMFFKKVQDDSKVGVSPARPLQNTPVPDKNSGAEMEVEKTPLSATNDRVIRVFISSTFRDMMRERDLLVKEVFPELRRKCAKRFVTFTEVDLRWGITEAQANEGQVLPLCLAEIERSRPYFIGLLAERYGWIPDTIRPEVIAREPWLQEHVQGRTSVTELEIFHGVLNNPQMQSHAFFYFRDPTYANNPALTDDERRDMIERDIRTDIEQHGVVEAIRRTEERKSKLAALKQRIRDSKLPLVEPYANPKALAESVRKQFDELIDRLYPEDQTPDPLSQERMVHEAHAKNKLFACIDRPAHLAVLNTFAAPTEHNGKGLVVTGESGGGKTALLAAWTRDWAKSHPEDFLFQHYFGATPDSASPEGFLRRLLGELKARFGITDDVPTDPEKLRDALPLWLAQTIGKDRVVLVLDGLNQVQGSEPDRHLFFLSRHFPPHVIVLASALDGPGLDELRERGWTKHDLPRASEVEVDAMVSEYLTIHARALASELRHELLTAPGAKNPLYLRTVLEELRQFGSFEQLPQRVRHYLEADNPKELFLRVVARWQEDFDGKDPEEDKPKIDLVRRALTYLWAARQGLSEPEWLDLLGMPSRTFDNAPVNSEPSTINSAALPRALWTPFFLSLEPHLSQRAGLYAFGHDFLRQAVETTFVPSDDLQQTAHLSLADYFEHQPAGPRWIDELPWQLNQAAAWTKLRDCLTDMTMFEELIKRDEHELHAYWLSIGNRFDMAEAYWESLERWRKAHPRDPMIVTMLNSVGRFMYQVVGRLASAKSFIRKALEIWERAEGIEKPDFAPALINLGAICKAEGKYQEAEALFRKSLTIFEGLYGREDRQLVVPLNNLAGVLALKGDHGTAEMLQLRALAILRKDPVGASQVLLGTILHNVADRMECVGNLSHAEQMCREALEVRKRHLGPKHPDVAQSLCLLAVIVRRLGDEAEAERLHCRALEIEEAARGPFHPTVAIRLNNLALLLKARGEFTTAEQILRRAVAIGKQTFSSPQPDLATWLNNLAGVLVAQGHKADAVPLLQEALEILDTVLGKEHNNTYMVLDSLADILLSLGRREEAFPILQRAVGIHVKQLGLDHIKTFTGMANLGFLFLERGMINEAIELLNRSLSCHVEVLGETHPRTVSLTDFLGSVIRHRESNSRL